MTEGKKTQLFNDSREPVFPVTSATLVYDKDGRTTIDRVLDNKANKNVVDNMLSDMENKADKDIVDGILEDMENKADSSDVVSKAYRSELLNEIGVKFIAHRGASWAAPENTEAAFRLAKKLGFWAVECDVVLTSDGVWIVNHDYTIDRMTNGEGTVKDLTYNYIKNLIIDAGNNVDVFSGQKVLTLEEFLILCKELDIIPVIEVKSEGKWGEIKNLLTKYGMAEKVIIISQVTYILTKLREVLPYTKMQYVFSGDIDEAKCNFAKGIGNCDLDVDYTTLTDNGIALARANGFKIGVWTVNDIENVRALAKKGVDYITSDIYTEVY